MHAQAAGASARRIASSLGTCVLILLGLANPSAVAVPAAHAAKAVAGNDKQGPHTTDARAS